MLALPPLTVIEPAPTALCRVWPSMPREDRSMVSVRLDPP